MGKISPELLNPAVAALALKQEDERLKTLDPVVITSSRRDSSTTLNIKSCSRITWHGARPIPPGSYSAFLQ